MESGAHPGARISAFYKYSYRTIYYIQIIPQPKLLPVTVGLTVRSSIFILTFNINKEIIHFITLIE